MSLDEIKDLMELVNEKIKFCEENYKHSPSAIKKEYLKQQIKYEELKFTLLKEQRDIIEKIGIKTRRDTMFLFDDEKRLKEMQENLPQETKDFVESFTKHLDSLTNFAKDSDTVKKDPVEEHCEPPVEDHTNGTTENHPLQYVNLYIGKEELAEKLDVKPSQLVVANIENNLLTDGSVMITVAVDSSAQITSDYEFSPINDGTGKLRRQRLNKGENLDDLLYNELEKLSERQDEITAHYGNVELFPQHNSVKREFMNNKIRISAIRDLIFFS